MEGGGRKRRRRSGDGSGSERRLRRLWHKVLFSDPGANPWGSVTFEWLDHEEELGLEVLMAVWGGPGRKRGAGEEKSVQVGSRAGKSRHVGLMNAQKAQVSWREVWLDSLFAESSSQDVSVS